MYSNMRYIQIPFRNPKFKKGIIRTCFAHKHHSDAQNANMHLFEHALHTKLIIPAHQIEKPIHSRMFHMLNHHSETPNFKTYYNDLFEHVVLYIQNPLFRRTHILKIYSNMLYIKNPSLRHTKPNYMYSNMR